jgi:hypothetical protein
LAIRRASSLENIIEPRGDAPAGRYHSLSAAAVFSLVFGVLSSATFLGWTLAFIPILAIALGWWALWRIGRTPEEITGTDLAKYGIILAVVFWIGGYSWLLMQTVSAVPFGYTAVTYAELQPDPKVPDELVPQSARDLDDKKVFIKGYISPTRQQTRLKRFILCPTNGVCQFCIPNPKRTEMIRVTLTGDLMTDYTTRLIGIAGRLHIDEKDPTGVPYQMDVDDLR